MIFGLGNAIGAIFGLGKQWLTGYQKKQQAKIDIELAEMENKARLLREKESNNHAWEMANLTDKDKWLRRISFAMFSAPFFVALVAPEQISLYFESALKDIPHWWVQTFVAINGGIWGLSSLKNVLPGIVDVFKK